MAGQMPVVVVSPRSGWQPQGRAGVVVVSLTRRAKMVGREEKKGEEKRERKEERCLHCVLRGDDMRMALALNLCYLG